MLNGIIRFALRQPLLIVAVALLLLGAGAGELTQLPVDVFPDLDRPRVVVLTEAPGLAPEEVETLINLPLEQALNGAAGVEAVRTSAGIGVSVIFVEFAWDTRVTDDRQVVSERLATVVDHLPDGVQPKMAPLASIMGQIMLVGMYLEESQEPDVATSMLELRRLAQWVVRPRLMNIHGAAQVFTMGGENGAQRQIQVLVNPDHLRSHRLALHDVEQALAESNVNATGGYVEGGQRRLLVRSLGRIEEVESLNSLVVDGSRNPPVLLSQVARVVDGPAVPIGRAAVNGKPAVMLVIAKQPGVDTRKLTREVLAAFDDLKTALPTDVRVNPDVYRMDRFIDRAIENVLEALRDGSILVVIILFMFLLNLRTTFITLTAIPLSIVTTILVFRWFGMSINTMTLGGIAVAMGELVDDAIVDVENIYRRLGENWHAEQPRPVRVIVYEASAEIRQSIVFGTFIVVLVFVPLFALGGMEGRLFAPLGIAYIVSILASLLVSLTVTPVLSAWLLGDRTRSQGTESTEPQDSFVLSFFKRLASGAINLSLRLPALTLGLSAVAAIISCILLVNLGRNFLPPFNEGSVQVNIALPAGTSLEESDRIVAQVDRALLALPDVVLVGRRTGRAEEDEHVAGVDRSELILELDPESSRSREQQLDDIRAALDSVPGVENASGRSTIEQPISHLMSHMLSGVKAQIAIKIYGDDLAVLRSLAQELRQQIEDVVGVEDLMVEQQVLIPQLQIQLDRRKLAERGLTPGEVNHVIETAMNGRIMTQLIEGQATFDVVVRLDDRFRENVDSLRGLALPLPSGGTIPLVDVADFFPDQAGPNEINRENGRRRIVVQCNTKGRALSDVRNDIQRELAALEAELPSYGPGYSIVYSGQFESEQAATRLLLLLSIVSLSGVFLTLYTMFRSANLALQVMAALPMAAIGAVAALLVTGQSLSVPALVGFVSLTGIASRNGILLISHYLHLVRHEGERLSREMILRAGRERVAPVLMTALTSGIGLVPLALAGDAPGKEILYPVATVIIGGLISTTLLEFFVRPALFWKFGRNAATRRMEETT
ncbi:MAG: CusA/CzcA family heavy metal efflux RND transporter [Planctomycetaceae bacterium]|nr:CusA/CzcA family heavy metal efflux RND transporter [Planctomycetaceae bacterium]